MNLVSGRLTSMFHINKNEWPTALLMFAYFFLVLAMYMIGKAARDAMFIGSYGALKLPYALVAQAVALSCLVAVYIKFSRRLNHYKLSLIALLSFAGSSFALWVANCQDNPNLIFAFYIWVGVVGAIAPMQVWTMANLIYNAREAKRLFGFVGSGGILGSIFGGFVTRKFAPLVGTENLIPIIVACLLLSAVVLHLIWQRNRQRAALLENDDEAEEETPQNLWQSAALIGRSRYLRLIAALVAISAMATTVAYVQFSVLARMHIQNTDNLASFFGGMYEGLSWVAFLMQFLFSGRLMNRWGLGLTIFILPLSLLFGSVVALMYPTLWAAVLLRGSDQVFRHSIDRSTTEMLYLPIAPEVKIQAKSFIDTVVWRVGDALAAVGLMFFAGLLPTLNQTGVTMMNMLLVLPWIAIAYLTGREYVNNLRASLQRQELPQDKFAHMTLSYALTNRQTMRVYQKTPVNELLEMLDNEETRAEAVRELYRRRAYLGDLEFAEERIERILKAEIKAYRKRAKQIKERAITSEAQQSLERVFRLLGLLYPPADIYYAYHAITSGSVHLKANALEFLDNVLQPDIKRSLIPVIEVSVIHS
ncbi:MAG TPA: Npt1/Npt2 family nucleotide transporter [Blastocatellia bacterium]|nr:Npt1/Npt2 family nucleotide transporter [Blastocatellia bacterium]